MSFKWAITETKLGKHTCCGTIRGLVCWFFRRDGRRWGISRHNRLDASIGNVGVVAFQSRAATLLAHTRAVRCTTRGGLRALGCARLEGSEVPYIAPASALGKISADDTSRCAVIRAVARNWGRVLCGLGVDR